MKTTLDISDALFVEVKSIARDQGVSFRSLVEQGLRKVLNERKGHRKPFKLADASVKGGGWVHPDIVAGNWQRVREMANDRDDL